MESVLPKRNWLVNLNVTSKIHRPKRGNTVGEPRSNFNAGYSKKTLQLSSRQHRLRYWKRSSTLEISQHTPHPPPDTSLRISPDTLLDYFVNKVQAIRESTKDAPVPDFSTLPPPVYSLRKFNEVTTAEVERLLSDSSTKQCELDSAPVWLLKSLLQSSLSSSIYP